MAGPARMTRGCLGLLAGAIVVNSLALVALAVRAPTLANLTLVVLTGWLDIGAVVVLRTLRADSSRGIQPTRLGRPAAFLLTFVTIATLAAAATAFGQLLTLR